VSRAACYQHPTLTADAWTIADNDDKAGRLRNWRATQTCGTCPLKQTCLKQALELGDAGYIYGAKAILPARSRGVVAVDMADCQWCGAAYIPTKAGQRYCGVAHTNRAQAAARQRRAMAGQEAA
jgi:hypothetical protein